MLTDQVEAQGEKISDAGFCLEEHREKLNATEEMLQQVCSEENWGFPAELLEMLRLYVVFALIQW